MSTLKRTERTFRIDPKVLYPFCNICGWRKGGIDSWDGTRCKCGHGAVPLPSLSDSELIEMAQMMEAEFVRAAIAKAEGMSAVLGTVTATAHEQAEREMDDITRVFITWLAEQMEEIHPDVMDLALTALSPYAEDARLTMDRLVDAIRADWIAYRTRSRSRRLDYEA